MLTYAHYFAHHLRSGPSSWLVAGKIPWPVDDSKTDKNGLKLSVEARLNRENVSGKRALHPYAWHGVDLWIIRPTLIAEHWTIKRRGAQYRLYEVEAESHGHSP
jgi:hypothetical protein